MGNVGGHPLGRRPITHLAPPAVLLRLVTQDDAILLDTDKIVLKAVILMIESGMVPELRVLLDLDTVHRS